MLWLEYTPGLADGVRPLDTPGSVVIPRTALGTYVCAHQTQRAHSDVYDVRITVGCFLIVALRPRKRYGTARVGFHHERAVGDQIVRENNQSLRKQGFRQSSIPAAEVYDDRFRRVAGELVYVLRDGVCRPGLYLMPEAFVILGAFQRIAEE
jgi:hypothetical protein